MRGVAEWGRPFSIEAADETLKAERALEFRTQQGREGKVQREGRVVMVGFASGTLRVRVCAGTRTVPQG